MNRKSIAINIILVGLILFFGAKAQAAPSQQGGNILPNPGFEDPFTGGSDQFAQNWSPWHKDTGKKDCNAEAYWVRPHWGREANRDANFVYDGFTAQSVGNQFDSWNGGVFQTVDVVPGQRYKFSFFAKLRASNEQVPAPSDFGIGIVRAGIDPNGSGIWSDSDVVWGVGVSPVDSWLQASVEATATGSKMSVYVSADFGGANNCRAHLDAWFDNASLVSSAPPPTATRIWPTATRWFPTSTQVWPTRTPAPVNTPLPIQPTNLPATAAPPAIPITRGPTPTPDVDGFVRMAVPPGGSLWAVAANAGITLDEIASLNNIATNAFVQEGQLLIVGVAETVDPAGDSSEAETDGGQSGGSSDSGDEPAAPQSLAESPTAPPPLPTATSAPSGGRMCLNAFGDIDGNGKHEASEGFMAGVTFMLLQNNETLAQGISRGTDQAVCFENLAAGSYLVREVLPSSLEPTTSTELMLDLEENRQIGLEFGSRLRSDSASTDGVAIADTTTNGSSGETVIAPTAMANPDEDAGNSGLAGYSGVIFLGLAAALGAVLFFFSRQR